MTSFIYDKLYHEIYALLSLRFLYDFCNNFSKGESPDWQNEVDEIGLEVVRAENKHIGYSNHLAKSYLGKSKHDIPTSVIDNFKGQLYFEKGRLLAISDSNGLVDGTRHVNLAINIIDKKTQLLNKPHFRIYNRNLLYIFLISKATNADIDWLFNSYQYLYRVCCRSPKPNKRKPQSFFRGIMSARKTARKAQNPCTERTEKTDVQASQWTNQRLGISDIL